jgi:hypothetical protein
MSKHSIQSEGRPFVAWRIMKDMIESFDDEQLDTVFAIVKREKMRRVIRDFHREHIGEIAKTAFQEVAR